MSQTPTRRDGARPAVAEPFHSLLAPIDLLPIADRVLARTALLPLAERARLTILHVVPGGLLPGEQRDAERDASHALAEEARHLRRSLPARVRIDRVVRVGAADKEIAACAKDLGAELIVMGRGGGRALRDALLGSTAERVIRQTRIPVLAVRRPARAPYERPAMAVDLDPPLVDILRGMLRVLPARPDVALIHAFDVPYRGRTYPSLMERNKSKYRIGLTRELTTLLGDAMAAAGVGRAEAPSWSMHVRYGLPGAVVEKVTRATRADLLVVGTHGHAGAAAFFLGTVAGELLRSASCDVLVVPFAPSRAAVSDRRGG